MNNALWQQGPVLVTGGAGFIGSALVWELNRRGVTDIWISDQLGHSEKWKNLVPLQYSEYLEVEELSRYLQKDQHSALPRFSVIFHLGACSATTEKNASYLIENNYRYTQQVAELALITQARLLYASSAATYGDGEAGMEDNLECLSALRPLNMYGYSKHMFDLYAKRKQWFDRIIGLKFFNVYGPNEEHKGDMRSVVSKAFQQIKAENRISLFQSHRPDYRDGEQNRDFLYVKDAVNMVLYLASGRDIPGGLYNLGSGVCRTWIDLANAIFAALDMEPNIEFVPMPEQLREKYQYTTQANISKLRSVGYSNPITSLEEAVKDYVQNYLRNDTRLTP